MIDMIDKNFHGQQCQDEKLNKAFKQLHNRLVDEIIGFCRAYGITIDDCNLNIYGLTESIESGSWHPCTDSELVFMKYSNEYKKAFWEMDENYLKGKTKKELDILKENQVPYLFSA